MKYISAVWDLDWRFNFNSWHTLATFIHTSDFYKHCWWLTFGNPPGSPSGHFFGIREGWIQGGCTSCFLLYPMLVVHWHQDWNSACSMLHQLWTCTVSQPADRNNSSGFCPSLSTCAHCFLSCSGSTLKNRQREWERCRAPSILSPDAVLPGKEIGLCAAAGIVCGIWLFCVLDQRTQALLVLLVMTVLPQCKGRSRCIPGRLLGWEQFQVCMFFLYSVIV